MKDFQQTLQELVNEPYDNLLDIARGAFARAYQSLETIVKEQRLDFSTQNFIAVMVCTGLAVDGSLSAKEKQFAYDIFGTTEDVLLQLAQQFYTAEAIEMVNNVIDSLPPHVKTELLLLCACFLACDETINKKEYAFLEKILK
jgi:hypothetical protein